MFQLHHERQFLWEQTDVFHLMNAYEKAAQDPALRCLLDEAVQSVQAAEGSILLLGADGGSLRFVLSVSPVSDTLLRLDQPLSKGITGLAVSLQQPMVVNETHRNPVFDPTVDGQTGVVTRSLMVVPLATPHQEFGALTAINPRNAAGFSSEDLRRYTLVSEGIAQRLTELDLGMEDVGALE